MQINNVEVDFKISRLKDAAAMELALTNMGKREKKINDMKSDKNSKLTEVIGGLLDMFRNFFLEATGTDVLNECGDVEEATQAYYTFLDEIKKQKDTTLSVYSPDRIK